MQPEYRNLKVNIYDDNSVAFNLWEIEVLIIVDLDKNEVYVDTEFMDDSLNLEMLKELSSVIEIIQNNLDEIRDWLPKNEN